MNNSDTLKKIAEDEKEIYNLIEKLKLIRSLNPFRFFEIVSNIKNQKVLIMILEVCK